MVIFWRGWGFVVLPFGFAAAALAAFIIERGEIHSGTAKGMIDVACAAAGALGVWLFAYRIESRPGRVFIDKETGHEFEVGRSAGSLFFIKTRYWPYIIVALGALLAIRPMLAV